MYPYPLWEQLNFGDGTAVCFIGYNVIEASGSKQSDKIYDNLVSSQ